MSDEVVAAAPAAPAEFERISIPLVRRIYPQLIANDITSVQPLLGPTGLLYYLRFRYSENRFGRQFRDTPTQKPNWKKEGF
jgi:hypothetical protein